MSCGCYYGFGVDHSGLCPHGHRKWKAKHGAWRVPEKVLFLSALAGGSLGALAGMALFRHKTRHWSFRLGMPAILILQVVVLLLWSWRGIWFS